MRRCSGASERTIHLAWPQLTPLLPSTALHSQTPLQGVARVVHQVLG